MKTPHNSPPPPDAESDRKAISSPTRVVIVEDEAWMRDHLRKEIDSSGDFICIGQYRCGEDALRSAPDLNPELVIMDINLPGADGVECVRQLKQQLPNTHFLMLTVYEESGKIFNSLLAGACGYLLKRNTTEELLDALRQARDGGAPLSCSIARKVVAYFNQLGGNTPDQVELSTREREVLELLAKGAAYKQIADELSLSLETIRMYVKRIYSKLHVHSRSEAAAKYFRHHHRQIFE